MSSKDDREFKADCPQVRQKLWKMIPWEQESAWVLFKKPVVLTSSWIFRNYNGLVTVM